VQESGRSGSTDTHSGPAPEPVRRMVLLQPEGEHSPELNAKDSHLVFPEETGSERLSGCEFVDIGLYRLGIAVCLDNGELAMR
jgi:hypothetical protein